MIKEGKMQTNKKTVGIFTLNGYLNYGNRLQLFAMSTTLKKLGFDPIVCWRKSFKTKIKHFLKYSTPLKANYPKDMRMKHFTESHLPRISNSKKVSYSVIGSDQVWNPEYLARDPYLLEVPNKSIKISYAASLGVETLDKEQEERFKKGLKKFDAISVREKRAMELLQPLTDKTVIVTLDPTLLLDEYDYQSLEKKPDGFSLKQRYILCYILGDYKYQEEIREFADKNGLKVILFSDKRDSNYGVEEFLYLIHHAELVCTDSFHACVFSFLYCRPFVVFKRVGKQNYMYSRIRNFLDMFRLENHEFKESITRKNMSADYSDSKEILKKKRMESLLFLKTALKSQNDN